MKNLKRLLALIGVVLLAGMYILTLFFALTDNSGGRQYADGFSFRNGDHTSADLRHTSGV